MRNLADTIARLSANRNRSFGQSPGGPDRLSDMPDFGSNPGQLDARIFVPTGLPQGAPLVVVLHGCTQTAAGYDHAAGWSRLAEREGFAVLYPQQRRSNNPNLCFNWFVPGDIRRDQGEALSIRQMIETLSSTQRLDPDRVYVAGLSAGGAMASVMLATYPEVFAGGAIIAGLPYATAASVPEAFDRMRGHGAPDQRELQKKLEEASDHAGPWPRISVWHGSADQTVAASNALLTVGQWQGVHGAAGEASREEIVDGHRRLAWDNSEGTEAIEYYLVQGMPHGTPLDTADGLSHSAPYMIDTGISSTQHIGRFWGLVESGSARILSASSRSRPEGAGARAAGGAKHRETRSGFTPHEAIGGARQIIEKALRKAGLR
ncbi:MAG: PHB depolymerase family esterase [Alphaproteobacteria bacterium]|nr:PHB depolymerase family esterase [Alphaproteobacteria bacterium]MBU0805380.1 PHB depolymerase family esterase [Alphaproteobacteria bacterium]MBU0873326.1 PHB depolymerase family esterase [Alphaproteobacteria bacterium]MBU1401446.1 PHB depolymerase family esterase [Alphaproteobacteria bacterium]MBU1592137.1 PHB depolymerase family esterase [Alphaproteobacteria bacterium]